MMETCTIGSTGQGNVVSNCFVASVHDELEDKQLELFCSGVIETVGNLQISGVVIDFKNVNIIDSYTLSRLVDTTKTIYLFGLKVMWAGLRPGVITTILDMELDIGCIQTGADIQQCVDIINSENNQ